MGKKARKKASKPRGKKAAKKAVAKKKIKAPENVGHCKRCGASFDNSPRYNKATGDKFIPETCFSCWLASHAPPKSKHTNSCYDCKWFVIKMDPRTPFSRCWKYGQQVLLSNYCQFHGTQPDGPLPFYSGTQADQYCLASSLKSNETKVASDGT